MAQLLPYQVSNPPGFNERIFNVARKGIFFRIDSLLVLMSTPPQRLPVSLAQLKRKRDEQERNAARPVFLSRQQRENPLLKRQRPGRANSAFPPPHDAINSKLFSKKGSEPEDVLAQPNYVRKAAGTFVASSRSRVDPADRNRFRFEWDANDDTLLQENDEFRMLRSDVAPLIHGSRSRSGSSTQQFERPSRLSHKRDDDTRHWSQKRRDEMTERDWRIFREDFSITNRSANALLDTKSMDKESSRQNVQKSNHSTGVPYPARNWDETGLSQVLLRLVRNVAKYDKPSPIQMAAIPISLAQRDCIGLAETGSGKTAAFVLPILMELEGLPRLRGTSAAGGPYAIVLAPTRELALQIDSEARKFGNALGIRVVSIIGGQPLDVQASSLEVGCEMVVCTPGRMVDLLSKQMAVLENCMYVVLDEADRMMDMGFEPQVAEVLDAIPADIKESQNGKKRRQTFMFSATMGGSVERLARRYLHEPVVIAVGETGKAADNVRQHIEYFPTENSRRERFVRLVDSLEAPILVFVNTRGGCEMVQRIVEERCIARSAVMHSGRSQDQREATLERFKSGRFSVLIATDVVGRGIDIKGVRNVINFELPKTIEAYTHRIGRTGRAGEKGSAWSLATEADSDLFGALCEMLKQNRAEIPPELSDSRSVRRHGGARNITD